MKIAQVSPLYESVPPKMYGGTERIVSYLTEELVNQGHEVTLFASGDSQTRAQLVAACPESLRLKEDCLDQFAHHMLLLEMVQQRKEAFDIIHYHIDYFHFPLSRQSYIPHCTTLHGRLNIPDLQPLYNEYRDMPVVSISNSQRLPLPQANWVDTVYHGLPPDLYTPGEGAGKYLAFIGRISPEKRLDRAIAIAKRTGIPLKVAAKIDNADREYYETHIKHLMDDPMVDFVGEIGDADKGAFLGNALALLFPIDWPEPFGLVMIEAMACGTPVIAYCNGSVSEIISPWKNGFIVTSEDEAVEAVNQAHKISRKGCRQIFEQKFTATQMAKNYLAVYEQLIGAQMASPLLEIAV
jgi:glycosyltransferase involved in cell wall biosynthesis